MVICIGLRLSTVKRWDRRSDVDVLETATLHSGGDGISGILESVHDADKPQRSDRGHDGESD